MRTMPRRKRIVVEVSAGFYKKLQHVGGLLGLSVEDYVNKLVNESN